MLAFALSLAASAAALETATPVKHLVVLFQENVSFDHYFATYPEALNGPGEAPFKARPGTPTVNGLTKALLARNPNSAPPVRLSPSQAATCTHDHGYTAEQEAMHGGLMDAFVERTGKDSWTAGCDPRMVMGYFDGNTVAALWRYAQRFAMSDNHFGTTFGPSTPGAINLVSGQTHGTEPRALSAWGERLAVDGTLVGDPDPEFDDCGEEPLVRLTGRNVGDLLNAKGVSWGWFQGGFRPTERTAGRARCGARHRGSDGKEHEDYVAHHAPFQYYKTTANPHHLPPSSPAMVGKGDAANHQYDLEDFWTAAAAGNVPAVSFLKAPAYRNGHAGYSDPLAEQAHLVETLNRLQALPQWKDMAVLIAYDDSDGWYDHVMPPIVSRSDHHEADALAGSHRCGETRRGEPRGRCGYGPRLPLLALSPWARENFVDHRVSDQTSILAFIEDNWGLGRVGGGSLDELATPLDALFDFQRRPEAEPLLLDPATGLPRP